MNTATAIDLSLVRQQAGLLLPSRDSVNLVAEARFRLLNVLQTSLYLDDILKMFNDELNCLLRVSGMQYVNESLNIQVHHGDYEVHHCAYRLITQSNHLGEIVFYRETRFHDQELETVETLLSTLLSPVRNALLYRMALAASLTDPLTGAGNRSALINNLQRELALARRNAQHLSVLVIDIDKFKFINDTHGHGVGDLVLQELVNVITKVNRSTDMCFRFGGEEFVVLLSNTNRKGAEIIASRLCEAIADCHICTDSGSVQISVSIGAASNCETDTEESLINRADKAMYEVKRRGGNNINWL
ncbi:MAG: GGDEF domain-containing protein [Pseudohongiella sp.]|nr:GGDEF domain-containing protein [Pseudohongiella sp.]MDO9519575.1 GGDEF domain-containing protein [Pseudohongiella sp.]MDP2127417.1 GGDEF domain-containing protein [Pseudohongiella sp.]